MADAIDKERLRILSPHLDRALELEGDALSEFLAAVQAGDPTAAADIETLLNEHARLRREGFLDDFPEATATGLDREGEVVGAYTLRSLIGQGGMGTVWLAHRSDGHFEGAAAVKLLRASLHTAEGESRFRREASILARLNHRNIAHLLDAGVAGSGQPFLVLEHVDGERIDSHCDDRRLPVSARIRLFLDVLAAVAHAHAHLVVHRDLKPSNVLVARDGTVKLLDFGIATLQGGSPSPAAEPDGERALTPRYAAPEQMAGGHVTTATDVYSLGVLLYLLLTRRHPSGPEARSTADLVRIVLHETAPLASAAVAAHALESPRDAARDAATRGTTSRALAARLAGDLDAIVARALQKDPLARYPSAEAMAEDLRRHLAHEPIAARPASVFRHVGLFARRHTAAAALAAVAVTAVAGGVAASLGQARRADEAARAAALQRDFAQRQLVRAEAINELNGFVLHDAAAAGRPFTASDLLARAERIVARQQDDGAASRVDLLVAIGGHYATQDEDAKAREVLARAYEMAAAGTDPATRATAACALASAVALAGDVARADTLVREADALLPGDPGTGLQRVFCLLRAAEVEREKGDADAAVRRVLEARALAGQSPAASTVLGLRVAVDLAESYRVGGHDREAAATFEDAFARLSALGRDDTEMAGTLLNNWAVSLEMLGRPREAEELLRRSIRISTHDGSEANVSPMLLNNLARVLRNLHRLPEARDYAERAYTKAVGAGHRVVAHQSLVVRASVYRLSGEPARAAAALAELEASARPLLPADHILFARIASERAALAQDRGEGALALSEAGRAIAIAEASPQRLAYLPELLVLRSGLLLANRQPAAARADAARALAMREAEGDPGRASSTIGLARLALGSALAGEGDGGGARKELDAAARHLEETLGASHPAAAAARGLTAQPFR